MVFNKKRRVDDEKADIGSSSRLLESPRKRTRREDASFPQTPAASGSSSCLHNQSVATPRTPYTPYPLHALDSPSNPFGRKRKERLVHSLPAISSFSKHIALRFQLVRSDISPRFGGVHRIVRVPLNYTFTHLRSLISWIFDTPGTLSNGKAGQEEYLFEIKSKVAVFSALYKPGQIKTGATTVKLSNVRDPGRWPSGDLFGTTDDDLSEAEEDGSLFGTEDGVEDELEDWKWMDEEDCTLGHAWPSGIDPLVGIIYHHSSTTQVHITVNNIKLPRQRGISNTPHVFVAKGRIHLSPPPLPRLNLSTPLVASSSPPRLKQEAAKSKPQLKTFSPPSRFPSKASQVQRGLDEQLTDTDADGDTDQEHEDEEGNQAFDSNHPFFRSPAKPPPKVRPEKTIILVEDSDEEDTLEENFYMMIDPIRWNEPSHAFALYFLQFMDPLGMSYDDLDESFFQEETVYDPFDNDEPEEVKKVRPLVRTRPELEAEEDESECNEEEQDYNPNFIEEEGEEESAVYEHTRGSTPGLTHCYSSASSLPPSSPGRPSSPNFFSVPNSSSISLPDPTDLEIVLEEHYPNKKYSQTPAPPKARRHRLRIKRLEKRLEKIKKAEFLCVHDEREGSSSKRRKGSKKVKEQQFHEPQSVKFTKPVLKEGEIWDPFGDEEEV